MDKYYNLLSVLAGLALITAGSTVAYLFQKYLFGRHHNKVSNIVDTKPEDKQYS